MKTLQQLTQYKMFDNLTDTLTKISTLISVFQIMPFLDT